MQQNLIATAATTINARPMQSSVVRSFGEVNGMAVL
jgi:hypothetical protein